MKTFENIGLGIPKVLLPREDIDPTRWAVVAVDQYTSEPEYWKSVEDLVGDAPSTLHIVYPEVYLNDPDSEKRIRRIQDTMRRYIADNIFTEHEGFVYVERVAAGRTRKGLMTCIDLEQYDYTKGSSSLVRATEGTIVDRLPPRVKIRKGAPLELPHIMVLIDDPQDTVIAPLANQKSAMHKLYDFPLMKDSGHLRGWLVDDNSLEGSIVDGLEQMANRQRFLSRYNLPSGTDVLLYAMGDGNHSLATAKAIWEEAKAEADDNLVMQSPLRYALVELVNVHDSSLEFEPIHRVLFELAEGRDLLAEMEEYFGPGYTWTKVTSPQEMVEKVDSYSGNNHVFGAVRTEGCCVIEISGSDQNLPVGTLQGYLDDFMKDGGARELDYVHGTEATIRLGSKEGNIGFFLPGMDKNELFRTVILDGALPRKTFSMGEADEKRFYMEARRIDK